MLNLSLLVHISKYLYNLVIMLRLYVGSKEVFTPLPLPLQAESSSPSFHIEWTI